MWRYIEKVSSHMSKVLKISEFSPTEVVNEETEAPKFDLAKFKSEFNKNYSYMSLELSDAEIMQWVEESSVAELPMEKVLDLFADYLLANGLSEVQEQRVTRFKDFLNEDTPNVSASPSASPESRIEAFKSAIAPLRLRFNIADDAGYFGDEWDNWEHMDEEERAQYFGTLFGAIRDLVGE